MDGVVLCLELFIFSSLSFILFSTLFCSASEIGYPCACCNMNICDMEFFLSDFIGEGCYTNVAEKFTSPIG